MDLRLKIKRFCAHLTHTYSADRSGKPSLAIDNESRGEGVVAFHPTQGRSPCRLDLILRLMRDGAEGAPLPARAHHSATEVLVKTIDSRVELAESIRQAELLQ